MRRAVFRRSPSVSRLLALLVLLGLPSSTHAGAAGGTAAAFLDLPVGARASALGRAYAAAGPDPFAIAFNPANIGTARRRDVALAYTHLFLDMSHTYLAYVHPLRERGTLGLAFQYVDLGSVQRTTLANPGGGLGTASANDLLLGLTYARYIGRFEVGVSVKYLRERLDRFGAAAAVVDFGATWRPWAAPGLVVGAAVQNLGTGLRFQVVDEPLPARFRVGANYRTPSGRWEFMGDASWIRDRGVTGHFGAEWWAVEDLLALRIGVESDNDAGPGVSLGFGLERSDLRFDYAFVPFRDLGNHHAVSLAYAFGPERVRAAAFPAAVRPAAARDLGAGTGATAPAVGGRVHVAPVEVTSEPGTEWFGEAFRTVVIDALRRRGVLLDDARRAEYLVEATIATRGDAFFVIGRVVEMPGGKVLGRIDATGQIHAPYAAWEEARDQVLRVLAPRIGFEPPRSPPAAPVPAPLAREAAAPAPTVRRVEVAPPEARPAGPALAPPPAQFAVGRFADLTGDPALAYVGREFRAALDAVLRRRGLAGARALRDVVGSYLLEADRLVVLVKVVEPATGRTLAAFEVAAVGADLPGAAEALARDLEAWIGR